MIQKTETINGFFDSMTEARTVNPPKSSRIVEKTNKEENKEFEKTFNSVRRESALVKENVKTDAPKNLKTTEKTNKEENRENVKESALVKENVKSDAPKSFAVIEKANKEENKESEKTLDFDCAKDVFANENIVFEVENIAERKEIPVEIFTADKNFEFDISDRVIAVEPRDDFDAVEIENINSSIAGANLEAAQDFSVYPIKLAAVETVENTLLSVSEKLNLNVGKNLSLVDFDVEKIPDDVVFQLSQLLCVFKDMGDAFLTAGLENEEIYNGNQTFSPMEAFEIGQFLQQETVKLELSFAELGITEEVAKIISADKPDIETSVDLNVAVNLDKKTSAQRILPQEIENLFDEKKNINSQIQEIVKKFGSIVNAVEANREAAEKAEVKPNVNIVKSPAIEALNELKEFSIKDISTGEALKNAIKPQHAEAKIENAEVKIDSPKIDVLQKEVEIPEIKIENKEAKQNPENTAKIPAAQTADKADTFVKSEETTDTFVKSETTTADKFVKSEDVSKEIPKETVKIEAGAKNTENVEKADVKANIDEKTNVKANIDEKTDVKINDEKVSAKTNDEKANVKTGVENAVKTPETQTQIVSGRKEVLKETNKFETKPETLETKETKIEGKEIKVSQTPTSKNNQENPQNQNDEPDKEFYTPIRDAMIRTTENGANSPITLDGISIEANKFNDSSEITSVSPRFVKLFEKEIVEQVQKTILNSTNKNGTHQISLTLNPEKLGEIKLTIQVEGNVVSAKMNVENSQVKQIIEQNMQNLKDSLAQQNLNAGSLDVNVGESGHRELQEKMQNAKNRIKNGANDSAESVLLNETQDLSGIDTGRRFGNNSFEFFA